MRWGLCWHGQAALNRHVAGSIPATASRNEPRARFAFGLIVQQEDTGLACRRFGCNSRWVHWKEAGSRRQEVGKGEHRTLNIELPTLKRRDLRRLSDFDVQCSMFNVRCSMFDVQCSTFAFFFPRPVVQRLRRLAHIQETMVRFHPGRLRQAEGPAETYMSSWSSGVLAGLSRRRPWVRIPSGTLAWHGTQTGRAAKLKPS